MNQARQRLLQVAQSKDHDIQWYGVWEVEEHVKASTKWHSVGYNAYFNYYLDVTINFFYEPSVGGDRQIRVYTMVDDDTHFEF